ncbi:DUF4837 family protein [Bacteroides caecigallinarum]|uniref:DUF4837 family protein n=1 Tax=Bacteroides caecigallinarum TaxID=1411144 RepID=UPI0019589736|nr:DUF4837 family protein [Bacteroides caecigallinarum]MBM6882081.1 DUF4837 family protein [Bacteroides caecigallinarum]MCF2582499.1 DUF4837 family protein [Bacteroides caecigallinarum]
MKRIAFYFSFVMLAVVLASCRNDGKSIITPVSSGRPYEVMVVADDNCWMSPDSALYHVLDTDVPGLPQAERSFRISRIRPANFDRVMRIFRNIIIADIQDIYTQTKFKYTRDAYASPQMIMTIQSPNQKEFDEYVSKHGQVIVDFFTRAEMNRQINLLREKHNAAISAKVGSLFDCDIWMPNELNSFKTGEDFFWASTNLNDMNFVMYSYPFRDNNTFTKEYFINKRDSVMKINIPGSMEGMYMETADSIFVDVKNIAVKGDYAFEARGLWEMRNDAMGGPFVSHVRVDRANARVIVVEGFVFKPDKLKRDLMRKLEACLYTLKLPAQKEVFELPIGAGVTEITITGDSIK